VWGGGHFHKLAVVFGVFFALVSCCVGEFLRLAGVCGGAKIFESIKIERRKYMDEDG
jgi:hypothetical protein